MGFFSWHRCDDQKVITNRYSPDGALPVEMIDDRNMVWREDAYEGYGIFGGHDYYSLLSAMNGGNGDRDHGIDLDFSGEDIRRPKFRKPNSKVRWEDLPDPEIAENQGYWT